MGTPQTTWVKSMRASICAAHEGIASLASVALLHPSLRDQLKHMQTLRQRLRAACSSPPPRPQAADTIIDSSSKREYCLLITDLSALWASMVPELNRLSTGLSMSGAGSSLGTTAEGVFWELWSCFTASCHAFETASSIWPDFWSGDDLLVHSAWYAAWHYFLTWLLEFSRSSAWVSMKRKHGSISRNSSLIVILTQPINSLVNLTVTSVPPATILSHMSSIPANFFPIFCSIISEQFGSLPPVVRRTRSLGAFPTLFAQGLNPLYMISTCVDKFLCWMNVLIRNFANVDSQTGYTGSFSFLTAPAVLQCLKVILVLPRDKSPASRQIVQNSAVCLHTLLTLSCENSSSSNSSALSLADRKANRDEAGLPLHLNPLLSKAALDTDTRVLHVLSSHMDSSRFTGQDSCMTSVALSVQVRIVQEWMLAGRLYPVPPSALATMVSSVVGLAKQCTLLGLQRITQLQSEPSTDLQHTRQSLQQQQQQQSQQAAARLTCPLQMSPESLSLVRNLVFFSSHFQIYIPDGRTIPNTSPELCTLNAWCVMPGWAASVEALHRGTPTVTAFQEVHHFAIMAARSTILLSNSTSQPSFLNQHISLAATVRKLMWGFQQRDKHTAMDMEWPPQTTSGGSDVQGEVVRAQLSRNNLTLVTQLAQGLLEAALGFDVLISGQGEGACSSSKSQTAADQEAAAYSSRSDGSKKPSDSADIETSGTGNVSSSAASGLVATCERLDSAESSSINTSEVSGGCVQTYMSDTDADIVCTHTTQPTLAGIDPILSHQPLCQLQAISLLTLAQIGLWLQEADTLWVDFDYQAWLHTILEQSSKLTSHKLKAVMALSLSGSSASAPQHQRDFALAWERYAMSCMNGRLVPGCGHLGCTNVCGPSEAMLKTQLCAGCRRARYCSVECQQAAWQGGHNIVCLDMQKA